jgi:PII-like signaling protein
VTLPKDGKLLRIFIGENDRHEGVPLFEWIVRKARETGLAGATVLRGLEGYGAHSRLHTAKILRLSTDLPIVIEIVDTTERIESFLPLIDGAVVEGLATVERVEVRLYRSGDTHEHAGAPADGASALADDAGGGADASGTDGEPTRQRTR